MMLKTEILSPLFWGADSYIISLPLMKKGDVLYLDITLNTFGVVRGLFHVEQILHVYENSSYTQRLHLVPDENSSN